MKPLQVACVSFLNALPFVTGLKKPAFREWFRMTLDTPAECTGLLISGAADLALIPVAAIGRHGFPVVSDYCIGADGKVDSVMLFSHRPPGQLHRIILDYQSQTSVVLARVLEAKRWKTGASFVAGEPGYEDLVKDETGGIVIGDRALKMRTRFPYALDLAAEWKAMTGLPFVFACWCAARPVDSDTLHMFNQALAEGLAMIGQVSDPALESDLSTEEQHTYLEQSVSYHMDAQKHKAMKLFLEYAAPYLMAGQDQKMGRLS
jgi:chorismate dehydratase